MAKRKKTNAELLAENKFLRGGQRGQNVASVLNNLIQWGGLVAIFYFGYLTVDTLAGQTTTADIGINFLANIRISTALAWGVGAVGVSYGMVQRKLRRDTVERLQGRITKLERREDPNRSSSKLTMRGDTRKEDEL